MARTLLGTRIRERRRTKKLNQAALAKLAGISASYLNLIEHNKRGIAGRTLIAIATALGTDARELAQGASQRLINSIKEALITMDADMKSLDRTEEFIARFPDFARLIEHQTEQTKLLRGNLQAISDQINSDPFVSEAMHLMLSNITAIKSTAELLVDGQDMEPGLHARFLSNLLTEAQRLSVTSEEILEHFGTNQTDTASDVSITPVSVFEAAGFHLPDLEDGSTTPAEFAQTLATKKNDREDAVSGLQEYAELARLMPLDSFLSTAKAHKYNPIAIADDLHFDLPTVLHRMAHLPDDVGIPEFGLLKCDGSGAVTFRKQLPLLALPKLGSGCPIWPIYRSLSHPMQPIKAIINMPTGERFLTYSISSYIDHATIGLPARSSAIMLITSDYDSSDIATLPNLAVGLQCSVCPRTDCPARRSKYLLN